MCMAPEQLEGLQEQAGGQVKLGKVQRLPTFEAPMTGEEYRKLALPMTTAPGDSGELKVAGYAITRGLGKTTQVMDARSIQRRRDM